MHKKIAAYEKLFYRQVQKVGIKTRRGVSNSFLICILTLLLIFSPALHAQDSISEPASFYTLSYAGNNLWNPGVLAGVEYLVSDLNLLQKNSNYPMQIWFDAKLGIYFDPGSHAALYSNAGIKLSKMLARNRRVAISFQPLGVYRSMLGKSYSYEDGVVRRIPLAGNTYYAPYIGIEAGKGKANESQNGWTIGLGTIVLMPYNTYVMPNLILEIGYRFGRKERGI